MTKKVVPGYGKLLDAWVKPQDDGDPIGFVATTFTFNASFFEEECISRFLQFDSDPVDDGPTYLIERDSKLSGLICASVLVDQHYCTGYRSLRWDVLAARVKSPGILHAKVCLLYWSNRVRLIISSANLAEDSYRKNQEIFGVVDYFQGGDAPLSCLEQTIDFLKVVVNSGSQDPNHPAIQRWKTFLKTVQSASSTWGVKEEPRGKRHVNIHPIFSGPGFPPVLDKLRTLWPDYSPPELAHITSTYFDLPGKENRPAKEIWKMLKQKGDAEVIYYVTAEDSPDNKAILLRAPESLLEAQPANRSQVQTSFYRLFEQRQQNSGTEPFRPMHLKSIWLENSSWNINMIGSSNFSSIGLGYLPHSNFEANLAYIVHHENPFAKELNRAFPYMEKINDDLEWHWAPLPDEASDMPSVELLLPEFFSSTIFDRKADSEIIRFGFAYAPPTGWSICVDQNSEAFYDEIRWNEAGCPMEVELKWNRDRPPAGFQVTWHEAGGFVWWPVCVQSYNSLPPPAELKDLPLDLFLRIYTSARPAHQIIGEWIKRQLGISTADEKPSLDPHKRVDTSAFLLQRTRKLSWLFHSLRQRLERPVSTMQALEWRLRGPIGVLAISNAISREARSELERTFLTAELALELKRVQPMKAEGYIEPSLVKKEILAVVQGMRSLIRESSLAHSPMMMQYVQKAFEEHAI